MAEPVRALVVGSLVTDLAFRVPRRPEPGEVVVAESFARFRGGKGYNQAVTLARLGAQVAMIGAVGDDEHGRELLGALAREGIDTAGVAVRTGGASALAVPLITPDGDVAFVQYQGANATLSAVDVADLPAAEVLLLQGEIPVTAGLAAARAFRDAGGLIVLNPAPVHGVDQALLEACDVVVPNEVEAAELLGRDGAEPLDGQAAADELAVSGRAAVVTLGARGAAWCDIDAGADDRGVAVPPRVTAVDATAAGDAFCAALALARAEGRPWADAVRFACAAGAHAATVSGAEPSLPRRDDVERLLRQA